MDGPSPSDMGFRIDNPSPIFFYREINLYSLIGDIGFFHIRKKNEKFMFLATSLETDKKYQWKYEVIMDSHAYNPSLLHLCLFSEKKETTNSASIRFLV